MRRGILSYAKYLIPVALIAFIALSVDLEESITLLAGVDAAPLLWATCAGFPLLIGLRTSRWIAVARTYGVRYSFGTSVALYMAAYSAGFLVSDSLGAFVRSVYLYRDGQRATVSVLIPLWEKICELSSLLLLGMLAVAVLPGLLGAAGFGAAQIALAAGFVIALALASSRAVQRRALGFILRLIGRRASRLEKIDRDRILDDLQIMGRGRLALLILYSCGVRLFHFAVVYMLALALAIPITYWQTVLTMAVVNLVTAFPVTVAGIGTRDIMMVFIFSLFGLSAESAIALSLLILLTATLWRALGALAFPLLGASRQKLIPSKHTHREGGLK